MMRHRRFSKCVGAVSLSVLAVLFVSTTALAQTDEGGELEGLFNKDEQAVPEVQQQTTDASAADGSAPTSSSSGGGSNRAPEIKGVADLGKLSEFSDIAVIQKRYLPKTGRFEGYIAPAIVLNDAFFINYGIGARLGYNFSERFGTEILGSILTTTERQIVTDLREKRQVTTTSLVTPKGYLGVDFKWTPIYGKMTWLNGAIVPFDLYFSVGPGLTSTNLGSSDLSLHLGTGQIFARTKGTAFRWDFSWNMFTTKSPDATLSGQTSSFISTLYLSLGMSFFFPEATYR